MRQGSVAPALVRPGAAVMTPSGVPVRMAAPFGVRPLARSSVVGGAGATAQLPPAQPATAELHGMVLPGGPWRGGGAPPDAARGAGPARQSASTISSSRRDPP